jgi:hypothetical protein
MVGHPFFSVWRGLASLKRGSAIDRAALTSHREAGDYIPLTNDVK